MNKVYCVFKEDIIQMCYTTYVLDKIFKNKEDAEKYIEDMEKVSSYERFLEVEEVF
jgi:hypothetical protein